LHEYLFKNSFGVKLTTYEGDMMKEGALTSFTLADAYVSYAPRIQ